jgi:aminoglycoside 6'-N-acetyltransferase I
MPTSDVFRVTLETASCLGRIAEDVFDDEISPVFLEAYLAAPGHALFVAVADGVVIGQARGITHAQPDAPPQLYIDNLGVTPSCQRQGVATRLVLALQDWARANGCTSSWVATEIENAKARGFYAAAGFSGQTVAYYEMDVDPACE